MKIYLASTPRAWREQDSFQKQKAKRHLYSYFYFIDKKTGEALGDPDMGYVAKHGFFKECEQMRKDEDAKG